MAVNITITGNIYDTNKIPFLGSEVSYQVYFHDSDSVGSTSTWSDPRTSGFGQYNFNLADSDLLGTAGNVGDGDQVVVVFWRTGSDRNANCTILLEWAAFEIVLGIGPGMNPGGDSYVNDVQLKSNITPNLSWTFPDEASPHYVDETYSATNSSDDIHLWTLSGTSYSDPPIDMYHWYELYGQTINYVNRVNNSVYDWDDTITTTGTGAANKSHQWSSPGIYDVELVVEDECGLTATGTEQIQIYWHPPTCGITMDPPTPDPNTPVTFQFSGTDDDDTISYIEWTIHDDTNTTTSGAKDDVITHSAGTGTAWCGTSASGGAFTNSGSHLVEITIHYNDGFNNQTLDCDDTFTQGLFTGPTVSFSQDPYPAPVGSGITFNNTSTDPDDRVGLGLQDCTEYTWTFDDDGVITTYSGVPDTYDLNITPTSTNCTVELCAQWSDGFNTQDTCTSSGVPFAPYVTISVDDCYYNLNVVGTSNDGTVSGYSWTVASGAGETGPWTEIWTTPTGIDQNDKKVCFTSTGWYKATAYVYGGGTLSDYDTVMISEVCPTAISGAVDIIWNGTGPLDTGTDWTHSGYGTETTEAMHAGTNGLDATGMTRNDIIYFYAPDSFNIESYDLLSFWINIREWQSNKEMEISLREFGGNWHSIDLHNYTNIYNPREQWKKVHIPLYDFNISSNMIDALRFSPGGKIGIWLDDIEVSMGEIIGIPICEPDVHGYEIGKLDRTGHEIKPTMRAIVPSARIINTYPLPKNL